MNETILQIILATIPVIGVVLTGLVIPIVKSKLSEDNRKKIVFWAEIAAVAVEKYYEGEVGDGKLKKEYVMNFLIDTLKLDKYMSEEELSLVIDAVVENVINKTVEMDKIT